MSNFAVQYLGSRPKGITPQAARARLHEACQRLPISMVLLDWEVSPQIEEAVAQETYSMGAKLYRWQTWLTGDSQADLPQEWATVGLDGNPIPGYENDPDFSFICPNRSAVQIFLSERLEAIAAKGIYQGIFLDRIRFPSPALDPAHLLGCFCRDCTRMAADTGLELENARRAIRSMLEQPETAIELAQALLDDPGRSNNPLSQYLDFREQSISHVVWEAKQLAVSLGLEIGLDCFSPSLTRMVGQNLAALGTYSDWIKLMTYPRVWGPAGVSFELLGLVDWLLNYGLPENDVLSIVRSSSRLPVPQTRKEFCASGLPSSSVKLELERCRSETTGPLLAGIPLVELKTIHESTDSEINGDLQASRAADGLVLSWDLWQIPLRHLETIRQIWDII